MAIAMPMTNVTVRRRSEAIARLDKLRDVTSRSGSVRDRLRRASPCHLRGSARIARRVGTGRERRRDHRARASTGPAQGETDLDTELKRMLDEYRIDGRAAISPPRAYAPPNMTDRKDDEPRPADDGLDVFVMGRQLPEEIKRRRWIRNAANERVEKLLQPRIDAHIQSYGLALDKVDDAHRAIADKTELDLACNTRQAAAWIVSGRCIAYARAVVTLVGAGFGAESAVEMRAMHEATRLLGALGDHEEPDLLRRWLRDADKEWVRPWETRAAQERLHGRTRASLEAARDEAHATGDPTRAGEIEAALAAEEMAEGETIASAALQIYDVLSRVAHTRRSGTSDSVSVGLRTMATGPHPDPAIRGSYVDYAGRIIEEVLLTVGEVLGRFYPDGWFTENMKPLIHDLHELRCS
ncbi:MAG: hypothetical protein ACRDPM_11890, partial [Solirubrobacteraceae bacterium]